MVVLGLIVLTLGSQVIATPYGYGVKGGAAKADASAFAGAVAGVPNLPLVIPNGAGYSGSYSKSAASSFASSSSSSSASSSSYSFSGSGANGFGLNGGCSTGGCQNSGCSSGECKNNGGNNINFSSQGDDQSGFGSAAIAGAKSYASSPYYSKNKYPQSCVGENCNDSEGNVGCSTGKCGNKKTPDNNLNNDNGLSKPNQSNDCASGNCGEGNTQPKPILTDNNDIKVNVPGKSNSNYNQNSPSQTTYPDETNENVALYPGSQTLKPSNHYGTNSIGNTIRPSTDCNTPDCGNLNAPSIASQQPGYGKPSSIEPGCNGQNCISPSDNSGFENSNRPTSYNVPIYGTTIPSSIPERKTPCSSGDCQDNDSKNTYNNNNFIYSTKPSYNNPSTSKSPSECVGGLCTSNTASPNYHGTPKSDCAGGDCTSKNIPTDTSISPDDCPGGVCSSSSIPSYRPETSQPPKNCVGGYCTSYVPTQSQNPKSPSECSGGACTSYTIAPFKTETSAITPSTSYSLDHHSNPTPGQSGCKGPGCSFPTSGTYPSTSYNTGNCGISGCGNTPQTGVSPSYNHLPQGNLGKSTPTQQSSQTGLPGWLTQSSTISFPSSDSKYDTTNPYLSSSYKPSISSQSTPASEISPPSSKQPSIPGYGVSSSPFGSPKPNTQVYTGGIPNTGFSTYTPQSGSYGGTTGSNSNYGSTSSTATSQGTNPTAFPSTPQYKPSYSGYGPHSQAPSQGSPTPADTKYSTSPKGTPYTGGFNGPSGFLKPNDYSVPSNIVVGTSNNKNVPCATNNCDSTSSHFASPSAGTISNSAGGANAVASANAAASAVAYTGGFGGPPGLLAPNNNGKSSGQNTANGKYSPNSQGAHGSSPINLEGSSQNSENDAHNAGSSPQFGQAGAGAQANAVAIASAGAHAGSNPNALKGCTQGCSSNGSGANNYGGLGRDFDAALASAKSIASAGSYGGSYSSSSASAHASAGAATKGGYGK